MTRTAVMPASAPASIERRDRDTATLLVALALCSASVEGEVCRSRRAAAASIAKVAYRTTGERQRSVAHRHEPRRGPPHSRVAHDGESDRPTAVATGAAHHDEVMCLLTTENKW